MRVDDALDWMLFTAIQMSVDGFSTDK